MRLRMAIWAGTGALVVALWSVYFYAAHPRQQGILFYLVDLTCPIALARAHPLSVYFVALVNATTYALAGGAIEGLRWCFSHRHLPAH